MTNLKLTHEQKYELDRIYEKMESLPAKDQAEIEDFYITEIEKLNKLANNLPSGSDLYEYYRFDIKTSEPHLPGYIIEQKVKHKVEKHLNRYRIQFDELVDHINDRINRLKLESDKRRLDLLSIIL